MDLSNLKLLADKDYVVIPPISPSVLEEKQNILYVILTRLYRYAEELLEGQENLCVLNSQNKRHFFISEEINKVKAACSISF